MNETCTEKLLQRQKGIASESDFHYWKGLMYIMEPLSPDTDQLPGSKSTGFTNSLQFNIEKTKIGRFILLLLHTLIFMNIISIIFLFKVNNILRSVTKVLKEIFNLEISAVLFCLVLTNKVINIIKTSIFKDVELQFAETAYRLDFSRLNDMLHSETSNNAISINQDFLSLKMSAKDRVHEMGPASTFEESKNNEVQNIGHHPECVEVSNFRWFKHRSISDHSSILEPHQDQNVNQELKQLRKLELLIENKSKLSKLNTKAKILTNNHGCRDVMQQALRLSSINNKTSNNHIEIIDHSSV